jgi:hypothetical protein
MRGHIKGERRGQLGLTRPGRTIGPVKIQQRTSGGCWRTLQGLADFATVQSYLCTAKWHIDPIDALRSLFNSTPWLPPALQPGQ